MTNYSELKRYDLMDGYDGVDMHMEAIAHGDYVRYDDVLEMIAEIAILRDRLAGHITPPEFPRGSDLSHPEMRLIRERDKQWLAAIRETT